MNDLQLWLKYFQASNGGAEATPEQVKSILACYQKCSICGQGGLSYDCLFVFDNTVLCRTHSRGQSLGVRPFNKDRTFWKNVPATTRSKIQELQKDVHTEHCCSIHHCKYGNRDGECTVESGEKKQSFPCEQCDPLYPE